MQHKKKPQFVTYTFKPKVCNNCLRVNARESEELIP